MSSSYTIANLEAKITDLEERLRVQDQKIKLLGIVATVRHWPPTADPLENFFNAPEFWEVIFEDNVPCFNECTKARREAIDRCNGDRDCINKVNDAYLSCTGSCGELFPSPF